MEGNSDPRPYDLAKHIQDNAELWVKDPGNEAARNALLHDQQILAPHLIDYPDRSKWQIDDYQKYVQIELNRLEANGRFPKITLEPDGIHIQKQPSAAEESNRDSRKS